MKTFIAIFFLLGTTVYKTDLLHSPAENLKNTVLSTNTEDKDESHNPNTYLSKSEISTTSPNNDLTNDSTRLSSSTTSSSAVKKQEYQTADGSDDQSINSVPLIITDTMSPEDDGKTLGNQQEMKKETETKKQSPSLSTQTKAINSTRKGQKSETGKGPKLPKTKNPDDIKESADVIKKGENLTLSAELQEPFKNDSVTTHTLSQEEKTPSCSMGWNECSRKDDTVTEVAKDMMTFTLNLFKKLTKLNPRPNLLVSPISVAMALSHLMLGANGETKDHMLKALYNGVKESDCIPESMQNLTTQDSFLSASEIFYNKELHIHEGFMNRSARFYKSKGIQLPKDNTKSLEKINSWVSQRTNQLIPSLLQELPPDFQLILVNVIHYQGKWLSKFDPSFTKKEDFRRLSLGPVKVPLMYAQKYPLQILKDMHLKAQVARFPLSDNCSLLIFLPLEHKEDALTKMEQNLNQEIVDLLLTQLEEVPVRPTSVFLPQLKLDTSFGLNEALSSLGLYNLFEYPNLCALSNSSDLAVSDVHHHAFLEIKEDGVKAAAASAVTVARTITVFAVRRPFLFMLVSDINRLPILIGHVNDPSQ